MRPEFSKKGRVEISEAALSQMVMHCVGEYDKEIACRKAAISVYLSGFSASHRSSIEHAIKLASAYQNNGQPEEAIKVLTHYQKIAEEMLGNDAPLSVQIRNQLQQLKEELVSVK